MDEFNKLPEETDFTGKIGKPQIEPIATAESAFQEIPVQYTDKSKKILSSIIGIVTILTALFILWFYLQPRTPDVPTNQPLPGSDLLKKKR